MNTLTDIYVETQSKFMIAMRFSPLRFSKANVSIYAEKYLCKLCWCYKIFMFK